MQGTKLLLSFWLATASFCLLQISFGPGGWTETARWTAHQSQLEARLEALKADNQRLTARYEALRSSPEAVRLEARALGYFLPGEVPVRTLEGPALRLPTEAPDLSLVPPLALAVPGADAFFRVAWFLLFFVYWAGFLLVDRLRTPPAPQDQALTTTSPVVRDPGFALPAPWTTGLDFFRK